MDLQIGTPPQTLFMLPDAGSGNTVVQSSSLSEHGSSPVYNPSASSTSHQLSGYTYSECFSVGCDSGLVYTDVVAMGTSSVPGVPLMVMTASEHTNDGQSGGIGLSFGTPQGTTPRGVAGFLWAVRPSIDGLY
jgi:hypothetical protein